MKTFFSLLLVLASACNRTPPAATAPAGPAAKPACIDSTKIRKDAVCTMQYDPICGCDGKTYSNACVATNAGLTSFSKGACPGQE